MDILTRLRQDYDRFPVEQTYSLYSTDVYFKDPMTQFRGIERYQQMISFIQTWFIGCHMAVHAIRQDGNTIRTDWTLSWTAPLPWQPRLAISGWSELTINQDGLISQHIDYWHCSRLDVVKQLLRFKA
jgi:Uncharacterized conserved protein (DUF2358)